MLTAEILDLEESPIKVPTPLQIQVFTKSRKQADGPDLDNLKLNLANKSVVNVWNKRAAAIFAQRFITEAEFGCKDPKAISKAFMSHLKTLQTRYRKALRDEEENADLEYEMDMRMRKVAKARENRRRGVSNSLVPWKSCLTLSIRRACAGTRPASHIARQMRPWRRSSLYGRGCRFKE